MARIENHMYSIQEAFRECFYIVPDYQREYVWTDKEVYQLIDDINEQIEAGSTREYFVGTVLVSPAGQSPADQKNHYEVIDGQQRLTTFFLLLCAMKHLFKDEPQQRQIISELISTNYTASDGEAKNSLKLDLRYESADKVMERLVKLDAAPAPLDVRVEIQRAGIASFGSLENLVNAYGTLHQYLGDNYNDTSKLKKYWGYLANRVVFIQISNDVSSALKIFETINERGVGLNPMDLLKNLLFTQVKQGQFTQLKDEWKKITKQLEEGKEKPLRFLRYFLMATYKIKNSRGDATIREDEIYDWFVDKENSAVCDYANKPFEFVRKVIRSVEHYMAFGNGLGNDRKPSLAMDSLKRLAGGAFSLHNVLLLVAAGFPKVLFEHFVRQLESFLFYYIFTKTPTKELERNFSAWADELQTIVGVTDPEKQRARLNAFVTERFERSMTAKSQELSDALMRLSLYSMQQYRTRYLLARLTQYVDWAEENNGADYDNYKNKLGNLTLLEKPINIVAGNDFYSEKQAEYCKSSNYLTRSLVVLTVVGQNTSVNRINEKLASFDNWNASNIDSRHRLMVALVRDVWRTTSIDK